MSENKNLVVSSQQHLTTQLEIANIQLSIGSELTQDVERRSFVEILKSIDKEDTVRFLSENAYLNETLIERFKDKWSWGDLAYNRNLTWSLELIKTYEDKWWDVDCDVGFSWNDAIFPFIIELIDEFKDKWWDLSFLSENADLSWSIELIENIELIAQFQSNIFDDEYIEIRVWKSLSNNKFLPWSIALIEKFENRWDWGVLSLNSSLLWSEEFIEKFENKLNWNELSKNTALPWSIELIEKYKGYWEWYDLSGNEALPWTLDFFEKYKDRWNWQALSSNEVIPWSIKLIEKYQNRWNWEKLSENAGLPLSLELIEKYKDQWNGRESSYDEDVYRKGRSMGKFLSFDFGWSGYGNLSRNEALLWSLELIEKYKNKWYWSNLSENKALPWSLELIEKYQDKWSFGLLSQNKFLPWTFELIEKYKDKWDWSSLSANEGLPWTLELIEKFKENWTFECMLNCSGINLSGGKNMNYKALACLPKLSIQDIDEVMSYHFLKNDLSSTTQLNM